jgi:hypothetical protein
MPVKGESKSSSSLDAFRGMLEVAVHADEL